MSINDLIVPSTNIVACFLSAYYNIQGPHLPPKTNYLQQGRSRLAIARAHDLEPWQDRGEARDGASPHPHQVTIAGCVRGGTEKVPDRLGNA